MRTILRLGMQSRRWIAFNYVTIMLVKNILRWRSSFREPITSSSNATYKELKSIVSSTRRLKSADLVMLEGHRMVLDALSFGFVPHGIYASPSAIHAPLGSKLQSELERVSQAHFLSDELLQRVSDTEHSQGVIGLFQQPPQTLPTAPSFSVICDSLHDPGNMGSIIRTAYGMGVECVLAIGGVSCWNPKVVRSSMGTILRFPVIPTTWSDVAELLPASVMYMMADGAGAAIWDLQNVTKPLALVVGSEATGISQEGYEACAVNLLRVAVPMVRRDVESLNAGVAGGILIAEINRRLCSGR